MMEPASFGAGLVVHTAAESAGPIEARGPGAMCLAPVVEGDEGPEDATEPIFVLGVAKRAPLSPGHDIRACAIRIEWKKEIVPVGHVYFAADVAIVMLRGVEVLQAAEKVKDAPAIDAELGHEGRVPHEGILVECTVDQAGHEAAIGLWLA